MTNEAECFCVAHTIVSVHKSEAEQFYLR